eukprot:TRINITY_DN9934_c0_g1_i4.p1 TRINITY_DN9934_c0_g1~~TRINITY_DN9934_c0_g1_i4.p1  ORF type:complete len:914 (-),score=285.92 TRINITY_DN9934_c0_g1_i4:48-2789(-)
MGITGLLPVLKSITRNISLKELSGLRVAVDGYVWLHKGVYGCSKEIVQNIPTDKYVKYCMDNIKVLMEHGITPVIVFDGANLPMKQLEEEERRESREKYKAQAVEYTKQGKFNEANECYKKVVDITPAIAYRFIRELKIHGIEFIVAPYEADAQLAYLSQIGFVDAIISEDSDLLPYGASRVIYKFDKKSGTGQEILISDLRNNKELDFRSFNKDNFRHMCILSGCDYLKNIAGVGVKKAHQFVSRFKCPSRIIQAMRQVHKVPHNYENDFKRADLTFLHQWVWDPVQKKIVPLNHFEQDVNLDDFSHLGLKIDDKVGQLIAEGIINPTTKQPYECLPLDSQKPVTFMQKKPLTLTNTTQTKIIKPLKEVEYSTERKKTPLFLNKSTPPLQNTIDNQITVTSKYFNNKTLPLVPKTTPKPQILSPPTPPSNDNATNINAPSAPPFKKPRSFITRTDKKSLSYQHDSQMNSTQKLETIKNLNARFDCEMRELEYIDSNSTSPIEIREYHLKQQQCSGRVQFNMSTKSVSPPQYNLIQLSDEENIRELDEENDYDNDNDNDNDNDSDSDIDYTPTPSHEPPVRGDSEPTDSPEHTQTPDTNQPMQDSAIPQETHHKEVVTQIPLESDTGNHPEDDKVQVKIDTTNTPEMEMGDQHHQTELKDTRNSSPPIRKDSVEALPSPEPVNTIQQTAEYDDDQMEEAFFCVSCQEEYPIAMLLIINGNDICTPCYKRLLKEQQEDYSGSDNEENGYPPQNQLQHMEHGHDGENSGGSDVDDDAFYGNQFFTENEQNGQNYDGEEQNYDGEEYDDGYEEDQQFEDLRCDENGVPYDFETLQKNLNSNFGQYDDEDYDEEGAENLQYEERNSGIRFDVNVGLQYDQAGVQFGGDIDFEDDLQDDNFFTDDPVDSEQNPTQNHL